MQPRIEAIAVKLGYAPDPMLSALSAYRKSQRPAAFHANIGWINNHARPEDLYASDFLRYYQGAGERAKQLGYALEEIRLADISFNMKRLGRILDATGVKGLLLAPAAWPRSRWPRRPPAR